MTWEILERLSCADLFRAFQSLREPKKEIICLKLIHVVGMDSSDWTESVWIEDSELQVDPRTDVSLPLSFEKNEVSLSLSEIFKEVS